MKKLFVIYLILGNVTLYAQDITPASGSEISVKWVIEIIVIPIVAAIGGIYLGHLLSRYFRQKNINLRERELELKEAEFFNKTGIPIGSQKKMPLNFETPSKYLDDYIKSKSTIDDIDIEFSSQGTDYSNNSPLDDKINQYLYEADALCFTNLKNEKYKSAYSYALAAYSNYRIKQYSVSGRYYHFAGHAFRELGEYERAGICYKWSGDLYKKESKLQNARRSYGRARSAFDMVGDSIICDKIKELERPLEKEGFFGNTLEWWEKVGNF